MASDFIRSVLSSEMAGKDPDLKVFDKIDKRKKRKAKDKSVRKNVVTVGIIAEAMEGLDYDPASDDEGYEAEIFAAYTRLLKKISPEKA